MSAVMDSVMARYAADKTGFDAEAYWAGREWKKWVVLLTFRQRYGRPSLQEVRYVRARTAKGAIEKARDESYLPRGCDAHARLATPQDLGCVAVAPESAP